MLVNNCNFTQLSLFRWFSKPVTDVIKRCRRNLPRKSLKLDVSDKLWEVFTNFLCFILVISMAWCYSEQILWMLFGECGLEIWRILFGVFGAPNLLLGVLWLLLLWFCPFNNGKMLKHILAAHQYCVPVSLSILALALFSTYVFLYIFFLYLCTSGICAFWSSNNGDCGRGEL